ncbi:putative vitamin B6 transporter [Lophium mytilinum]|uniref:Putative vitamin B6 transporter n=1 Tax=Lophium mytilinum TaxID=390894 RepID=A0A6A6QET1_9PEZI|nr:putative vitamin B6 transporter [Lophium mytilinum]
MNYEDPNLEAKEIGRTSKDIERCIDERSRPAILAPSDSRNTPTNQSHKPTWEVVKQWNSKFEAFTGLESRGIARVELSERQPVATTSYFILDVILLWISCDLTANTVVLSMLGPLVFELSLKDAALCAVFGALIGSLGPAYICTWGPRSGNRTMIIARYFMGYYPSKLCCVLSLVIMLGYGTINCIITGQLLSAVQGGSMSLVVGILVVSIIALIVAVTGMKAFHAYERYAWFPQVLVLFVLIGSAGSKFDTTTPSKGDSSTVIGHRISFLSLCVSSPLAWATIAADFFVYYPPNTSKRALFISTYIGNIVAFSFAYLVGIGLASGVANTRDWAAAYDKSQGALILTGFNGLRAFGSICGVLIALGVISDQIAATYSSALVLQMLDRRIGRVPRWLLTLLIVAIYTACAIGGRNSLFDIFQNFLALMGYWVSIFVCIALEEQVLFRTARIKRLRSRNPELEHEDDGFDWDVWHDWKSVPAGLAALVSFLIGWVGAIVSMDQAWYVGPVAKLVGKDGADLGLWVATGFTLLSYPPLRYLELKRLGR